MGSLKESKLANRASGRSKTCRWEMMGRVPRSLPPLATRGHPGPAAGILGQGSSRSDGIKGCVWDSGLCG